MSSAPPPAVEQKARFETRRKVDLVLEWIAYQARVREQAGAFGRMTVELIWERGAVKRVKLVDELIVEDLTDKERELVLRGAAGTPKPA